MSNPSEPPSFLRRSTPGLKQPNPKTLIPQLITKIKQSYSNLQQKYSESSSQNETYLLSIYLKVLDKMLDQVVYAQEKVRMVDNQDLKDQKCLNYMVKISHYRQECYETKRLLEDKQAVLDAERKRTEELASQRDEIQDLCRKKDRDIEVMKMLFRANKESKEKELKQRKRKRTIEEIRQESSQQEQNPEQKNKSPINFNLSLTKNLRPVQQEQSPTPRTSKSVRLKIKSTKLFSNTLTKFQPKIEQKNGGIHMDKLSSTLWLYQPSSYRKQKYLNRSPKAAPYPYNYNDKQLQSHTSQQSTKKQISTTQSNNISSQGSRLKL